MVHARAAAAWGEFEVTHDISHLTTAKFLNGIGKKTKVLQRISTVGGATGSAETVRDVRGFSVKFFTEEGNHDIVGNDIVREIKQIAIRSQVANGDTYYSRFSLSEILSSSPRSTEVIRRTQEAIPRMRQW